MDNDYWQNATIEEKIETIVYLRECFYGEEAITGRVQRVQRVQKMFELI